jgi:hypothetical protein
MALSAAFLFGCQDQGPTQATLDDYAPGFTPAFKKGKPPPPPVLIWVATSGVTTANALEIVDPDPMSMDGGQKGRLLSISNGWRDPATAQDAQIGLNFTDTYAQYVARNCVVDAPDGIDAQVLDQILDDMALEFLRSSQDLLGNDGLVLDIDKRSKSSLKHRMSAQNSLGNAPTHPLWAYQDGGEVFVRIRDGEFGDPYVDTDELSPTVTRYTFRAEGTASVWLRAGDVPDFVGLACPLEDEVVIDVIEG